MLGEAETIYVECSIDEYVLSIDKVTYKKKIISYLNVYHIYLTNFIFLMVKMNLYSNIGLSLQQSTQIRFLTVPKNAYIYERGNLNIIASGIQKVQSASVEELSQVKEKEKKKLKEQENQRGMKETIN